MIKDILNTFGAKIFYSGGMLFLVVLTAKLLGAEGRGIVSLLGTSIFIASILGGFIGGASLVYICPRHRSKKETVGILKISYIWEIMVSFLTTAIFYIGGWVPKDIVPHIFFLGFFLSVFMTNLFLFQSFEDMRIYNLSLTLQMFFLILIFCLLSFLFGRKTVGSYILSLYISYIIGISFQIFFIHKTIKFLGDGNADFFSIIKEMIKFGFMNQLANFFQYLNYRFSYFVLNEIRGTDEVGIYSVGVGLAESVWIISSSFYTVQYAKITNTNDLDYARELTIKFSKMSFLFTFLALIPFFFIPSSFFGTIFGSEFNEVKKIILYLSPGILIFAFAIILCQYFAGIGKYHIYTLGAFTGFVFTITFNFLLVKRYGYIGSALSTDLCYLALCLSVLFVFLKEAKKKCAE
jgi:O-antigen/teichoic acid export membrane protein